MSMPCRITDEIVYNPHNAPDENRIPVVTKWLEKKLESNVIDSPAVRKAKDCLRDNCRENADIVLRGFFFSPEEGSKQMQRSIEKMLLAYVEESIDSLTPVTSRFNLGGLSRSILGETEQKNDTHPDVKSRWVSNKPQKN